MNSSIPKEKQKQYADYVKQITTTHSLPMNMAKAFLTGGVICVVGQIITLIKTRVTEHQVPAISWSNPLDFAKFVII